jgi:streptogramin lyase
MLAALVLAVGALPAVGAGTDVQPAVVANTITIGGKPCGVAGTPDAVWVSDFEQAALVRIDRATLALSRVDVPAFPCELTYARGALWVTTRSRTLARVDPVERRVVATVPVGADSVDVAVAANSIWVANYRARTVTRVDPRTNRPRRTIPIPAARSGGVSGIAAAGGYVWVGQTQGTSVFRIDPRTNRVKRVVTARLGPAWLAGAGASLWASNIYDGTVMRLDPASGRVLQLVDVSPTPVNLELVDGEVWVPNDTSNIVTRLDGATGGVLQTIPTAANRP